MAKRKVRDKVRGAGKKLKSTASKTRMKAADNWKWILVITVLIILLVMLNIDRLQFSFL